MRSEIQEIINENIVSNNKMLFNYIEEHTKAKYLLDNKKASLELDWAPKYSIEEGIRKTVNWSLKNNEKNNKQFNEEHSLYNNIKTKWF